MYKLLIWLLGGGKPSQDYSMTDPRLQGKTSEDEKTN